MRNILEELYYGNIRPGEATFSKGEEYRKAANQIVSIEAALMSSLDEVGQELYRQLTFAQIACGSIENAQIYADGFRTGAKIILACISQEDVHSLY